MMTILPALQILLFGKFFNCFSGQPFCKTWKPSLQLVFLNQFSVFVFPDKPLTNDNFLFLPEFCYRFDWSGGRDLYKHHHTIPALLQTIADAQKCSFRIVDHFHQSLIMSRFEIPKAQSSRLSHNSHHLVRGFLRWDTCGKNIPCWNLLWKNPAGILPQSRNSSLQWALRHNSVPMENM